MTSHQSDQTELTSHVRAMLRGRVICMLEDYGFARPHRLEMGYDLSANKIVVGLEFWRGSAVSRVSFKLEPDDYCESTVNRFAEQLAQDDRIPIAEEL